MACLTLQPLKRNLTNGIMSGNPSKKIRLDLNSKADGSLERDDLWGADDLTAEEFDMLEVQATQSCIQTVSHPNHNAFPVSSTTLRFNNVNQVDDLKLQQYELEGRVKLLTQSLEKSSRELSEERMNREKLISDKMRASYQKESELQRKIENLQSVLQFKEQEMKSIYSKLSLSRAQCHEKNTSPEKPISKNFEDFLQCSKQNFSTKECCSKFSRKNKLAVDSSKGKAESIEILSTLLCNRLSIPSSFSENLSGSSTKGEVGVVNSSPLCVIQLKCQKKSLELLEYCKSCLKQHILIFQSSNYIVDSSPKSAFSSLRRKKEPSDVQHVMLSIRDTMSALTNKNLDILLQPSVSHSNVTVSQKANSDPPNSSKTNLFSSSCRPVPEACSESAGPLNLVSDIVKALFTLADPKIFPVGYPKLEVIELALLLLFNFYQEFPEIFLRCVPELPIQSLLSPDHSIIATCTTMKLLASLSACENFSSYLIHKDNGCILCNIASCMNSRLQMSPENYADLMILILGFLSSVLSVHFSVCKLSCSNQCFSEVIKSIISLLLKYFQLKRQDSYIRLIMTKGFIVLHVMSLCIPGFKERRLPVEDEFISFVSNILALSKEDADFRELYEMIHNLWDFQTDNSEFDLDDGTDETQSSNEMETVDSN